MDGYRQTSTSYIDISLASRGVMYSLLSAQDGRKSSHYIVVPISSLLGGVSNVINSSDQEATSDMRKWCLKS